MTELLKAAVKPVAGYREESPRFAIVVTVVAVILVGGPLGFLNKKIGEAGARSADISRYSQLARQVDGNVAVVRDILEKGVVKEELLSEVVAPKGGALPVQPVVPTNLNESIRDPNELNVVLSAIYWNPRDPLVTIDDENYRAGDKVKGFTILEIRKTSVVFRSPAGEKVVKYFYDYLN